KDSVQIDGKKPEAAAYFKLDATRKTVLVTGGSLGAGTLNRSILAGLEKLQETGVQVIWQTGKYYYRNIAEQLGTDVPEGVRVLEFLDRMDLAYAMADVIISRAGAGTIAELCVVRKPVILVPSPNVAEDHQTKNAMALVQNRAAVLVADSIAERELVDIAISLINDPQRSDELSRQIGKMALPEADEIIANEVISIAG
ncbi:MAG TPA: glycosyltransferase, partial [Sphingobacteriaceae bacterium]